MDYMQLLYLQPTQKLPIVLLVSEERNTGKSTFLNFLKAVFENNVTSTPTKISAANSIPNLGRKAANRCGRSFAQSQGRQRTVEKPEHHFHLQGGSQGKDRTEIAFFAKFVLCSNNEYLPILIDVGETRYWVRKIMPLQSDDTKLSAKAKSGNTRISLFPDPKGTIHNTGKPYVVQPKTDTYRSLAENNPKQPQPTGNRNDRVVA